MPRMMGVVFGVGSEDSFGFSGWGVRDGFALVEDGGVSRAESKVSISDRTLASSDCG